MADTFTSYYNMIKVEDGQSKDTWGPKLNDNFDIIDQELKKRELGKFSTNGSRTFRLDGRRIFNGETSGRANLNINSDGDYDRVFFGSGIVAAGGVEDQHGRTIDQNYKAIENARMSNRVGSYVLATVRFGSARDYGDTTDGSNLRPSSTSGQWNSHTFPGTWRMMGRITRLDGNNGDSTTLFVRIS